MNGFEAWAEGKAKGMEVKTFGFKLGEKLVFPKLAAALTARFGGRMRLFVSGGAPLSPKINWFFALLGFTILEGYGLTETSAGTCVNRIGKNKIGTVGAAGAGHRGQDRRGRRDPHQGPRRHEGVLPAPRGHRRGAQGRLALHRRHRRGRRRRLPPDHRPQEGPHQDLGRQVRRPAEPRERAQGRPAHLPGGGARRPAQVRHGAHHPQRGERPRPGPPSRGSPRTSRSTPTPR